MDITNLENILSISKICLDKNTLSAMIGRRGGGFNELRLVLTLFFPQNYSRTVTFFSFVFKCKRFIAIFVQRFDMQEGSVKVSTPSNCIRNRHVLQQKLQIHYTHATSYRFLMFKKN